LLARVDHRFSFRPANCFSVFVDAVSGMDCDSVYGLVASTMAAGPDDFARRQALIR
jgi:hypothetical protein